MKPEHLWFVLPASLLLSLISTPLYSQDKILGEVQFSDATKVERSSGVWIDGQYLGYLKELKGAKKVMLLPGERRKR